MPEDVTVKYPGVKVVTSQVTTPKIVSVSEVTPHCVQTTATCSTDSELSYYSTFTEIDGGDPSSKDDDLDVVTIDGGGPSDN